MAFIPVPNVAEVTMVYTGPNSNRMVNVWHFWRESGSWNADDLGDLGEAMLTWESANARTGRSNSITCIGVECRDLTVVDSFVVTVVPNPLIVGAISAPVMPSNVTLATSLRTPFAGRSFRGRSYWIGLAETEVTGDFVAQARVTQIRTAIDLLRTAVGPSNGAVLAVVSKFANGAPRAVGVATAVTSVLHIDNRVDTQRRRLVGEGN